jgi:hypothetical protein
LVVYILLVVLAFIMAGKRNRAGCGWFVFILLLPPLAVLLLLLAGKKELPKPSEAEYDIAAPAPLGELEPRVEEPAFVPEGRSPPPTGASGVVVAFRLLAAFLLVGALSLVLYVLSHPGVSERAGTKLDSASRHSELLAALLCRNQEKLVPGADCSVNKDGVDLRLSVAQATTLHAGELRARTVCDQAMKQLMDHLASGFIDQFTIHVTLQPSGGEAHCHYDPNVRAEARRDQAPDFTPLLKPDIANNALANSELVSLGK